MESSRVALIDMDGRWVGRLFAARITCKIDQACNLHLSPASSAICCFDSSSANMGWQDTISAIYRDERFILTTIGVVSFAIVTTMIQTLNMIRDDNEVPPIQPKTQYITQETENSLQLDTLEKLLEHPNYAISEIALRILYDRAINDPSTIDVLLRGITRPKYDDRLRCLHTLTLLVRCTGGTWHAILALTS